MLVHLALQPRDEFTTTASVALHQHIPEPFLLRVSAELSKSGFIDTRRGPGGGVRLDMPASDITVGDVAESVDYAFHAIDCIESPDACMISTACSQRELWADVEDMLQTYLQKVTIEDLANKQQELAGIAALELQVQPATVA